MKSWALLETEINSQYSKRFEKFGPTAKGVFWASTARQEKRFDLILEEIQKISRNHIVLEIADIGCGYGSFADYLNRNHSKSKFKYESHSFRIIQSLESQITRGPRSNNHITYRYCKKTNCDITINKRRMSRLMQSPVRILSDSAYHF